MREEEPGITVLDQISSDVERRMGPHGPEPAHDEPNAPHEDRAREILPLKWSVI